MSAHLWDVDHPYYAAEGNYYKAGEHSVFDSWAEFAQPTAGRSFEDIFITGTGGNALYDFDDDLNFLWRWDWDRPSPSDWEWEIDNDPDFEMPGDTLSLFFMLQRKARCISCDISVTEADEPAVREWLTARASKMRQVWAPLLDGATS